MSLTTFVVKHDPEDTDRGRRPVTRGSAGLRTLTARGAVLRQPRASPPEPCGRPRSSRSYDRPSATIRPRIETIPASSTANPAPESLERSLASRLRGAAFSGGRVALEICRRSTGNEAARCEDRQRHHDGCDPQCPEWGSEIAEARDTPARSAKEQARRRGQCGHIAAIVFACERAVVRTAT